MPQPHSAHPMPFGNSCRYVLLVVDDWGRSFAGRVSRAMADHGLMAEIVPCGCAAEAVARLYAGRRYSAVIFTQDHDGLDGLKAAAGRTATPVLIVGPGRRPGGGSGWAADLAGVIGTDTNAVKRADQLNVADLHHRGPAAGAQSGQLVAVCGAGGTGASVVAAAVAASLAEGVAGRGLLLADLALRADQAVLHRLPDPETSLLDLIAMSRYQPPPVSQLRRLTLEVPGYRLLTGLRRPAHWTAVAPSAFDTALRGLRSAFEVVVAEVTGEFDGEDEVGSIDVEERNHMARQVVLEADVVVVVGGSGTAATRRSGLLMAALSDLGVDPARIQAVVNRVSAADRARWSLPSGVRPPSAGIPLADLPGVDTVPLPKELAAALGPVVAARLRRSPAPQRQPVLTPVLSGSMGWWRGSQPA